MDADQENRDIAKGSRRSRRKSSILKDSPGRPPLVKVEVNAPPRRPSKRVSFADTHTIKEFLATVGAKTEWNSSYETPANMVDSSQSMDLTNQSFRLDPERNDFILGGAEEQFLGGKPNHILSMNDTMAVPIAHSTMLPSPSVGLELEELEEAGSKNCSSSVAAPSGNVYHKGSVSQLSKENITSNKAMDMELTNANVGVLYKDSMVGMAGMNDADGSPGILSSLPNLRKATEKKVAAKVPMPLLHSEQNKSEIEKTKMSLVDMDMTEAVFASQTASRVEAPEQVIASMSSVNLELTEVLLAPNLVNFSEIQDDRELVTGNNITIMDQGNMEMTEALNPLLQSQETTDRPDVSKHSTSVKDNTRMNVTSMEMTKTVLPSISLQDPDGMSAGQGCAMNKTRKSLANMEMTKPVNFTQLISTVGLNGKETVSHGISENCEKDLNLVNMKVSELVADVREHSVSERNKRSVPSTNMEMTEAVMPSISVNYVDKIEVTKQAVFKEEKARGNTANMEMTEALVPSQLRDMESAGCVKINQEGVSGNKARMSIANMEMTEAVVPSQLQDTESIGLVKINSEGAMSNDTRMGLTNMEMTEAIAPSQLQDTESTGYVKISKDMDSVNKARLSVANMETTEAVVPFITMRGTHEHLVSKQKVPREDWTETGPENMEMTEAVRLSQSMIAAPSEIPEKCGQEVNIEHMETTESVIPSQCMEYFHGVEVKNSFQAGEDKTESLANMEMTEAVVPSRLKGVVSTGNVEISEEGILSNKTRMSLANMEITEAVVPLISMRGSHAKMISKSLNFGKDRTEDMEVTEAVRVSQSVIVDPRNEIMFSDHGILKKPEKKLDVENVEVTESLIPSQRVGACRIEIDNQFHPGKDRTVSLANMEMTEAIMPSQFQDVESTNNMEIYEKRVLNKAGMSAANMETTEAAVPFVSMGDCHAEMMSKSVISGKDRTENGLENMEMTEAIRLSQSMIIETSNIIAITNDGITEKDRTINKNNMGVMESVMPSKCMEPSYNIKKQLNSGKDKSVILPDMEVIEANFSTRSEKNHVEREPVKEDLFEKSYDKVIISRQVIPNPDMSEVKLQVTEASFSTHIPGGPQIDNISHMVEKSKFRMSSEAMEMTEPIPLSPAVAVEKEDFEGISRNDISAFNSNSTKSSWQPVVGNLETENERNANKDSLQQVEHSVTSHHEVLQPSSDLFANRMVHENSVPQGNVLFVKEMNNVGKSSQQSEHASDFHARALNSSELSLTRDIKDGGCATSMGGNQRMHTTLPSKSSMLSESNLIFSNIFDKNEIEKSKVVKDISQTLQPGESLSYNKEDIMEEEYTGNIQKDCRDEKNGKRSSDECDDNIQPSPKRFLTAEGSVSSSHDPSSPPRLIMERRSNNSGECLDAFTSANEPREVNTSMSNERDKAETSSMKDISMHENFNKSQMKEQSGFEEELDDVSVDLTDSNNSMNSSVPGSLHMEEKQSTSSRRKSFFEEFASEDSLYTSLLHKLSMVQYDNNENKIGVKGTPEKSSQNTPQKSVKDIESSNEAVVNRTSFGNEESPQRIPSPIDKIHSLPASMNQEVCAFSECDKVSLPSEEVICEDSTTVKKGNDLGNYIEKKKVVGGDNNIENAEDFVLKESELAEPKMNSQTKEGCGEASTNHLKSASITEENSRLAESYKSVSVFNGGTVDESSHCHSLNKSQDRRESDEAVEHAVEESIYFPCNVSERSGLLETSKDAHLLQTSNPEEISGVFSAKKTQIQSNNIEYTNYCQSEVIDNTGVIYTDVTNHNEATKPRAFENVSFSSSSKGDAETLSKKQDDSRIEKKSFIEDLVASLSLSQISFVSMSESFHKNKDMSRNESLTSLDKTKILGSSETQRRDMIESQGEVKKVKETLKKTEEMEAEVCCAGCSITEGSYIDNICGIRKWEVQERTVTTIKLGIQNSPLFVHLNLNKYDTHYLISSASWGPQAYDLKNPMAQLVVNLFGCRANSCLIAMNSEPLCEVQKFLPSLAKTFKDISDLLLELFQVSAKYITTFEQNSVKITLSSVEAHVSVAIWLLLSQPFEDPWQPYTIEPKVSVTIGNIRRSTFYAAITGVAEGPSKILHMADAAYSIIKNMPNTL